MRRENKLKLNIEGLRLDMCLRRIYPHLGIV